MYPHPMTAQPLARSACLAAAAATLTACSFHRKPTFDLAEVYALPSAPDTRSYIFVIEGANGSKDPLPLRDLRCTFTFDNLDPITITRSAEATLPARSANTFDIPITIPLTAAAPSTYALSGSVEYQLPGALADLLFDNNLRRTSASFSFSGNLSEAAPPPAPAPEGGEPHAAPDT